MFSAADVERSGQGLQHPFREKTTIASSILIFPFMALRKPLSWCHPVCDESAIPAPGFASLVLQTRLKPYLDQIELVIDESSLKLDAGSLNRVLPMTAESKNGLAGASNDALYGQDGSNAHMNKIWRKAA